MRFSVEAKVRGLPSADGFVHCHEVKHIWRSVPVHSNSCYNYGPFDCVHNAARAHFVNSYGTSTSGGR